MMREIGVFDAVSSLRAVARPEIPPPRIAICMRFDHVVSQVS